jgi:hypothetical protein
LNSAVWRTHPEVVVGDTWHTSDRYEDVDRLLREITPAPAPLAGLRSIGFGRYVEEFRSPAGFTARILL